MRAEQLTPALAYHGEGPVWDEDAACLLWVDVHRGDVLFTSPHGNTERRHVADVAACVVPRRAGGYVVATGTGFLIGDDVIDLWDDETVRMNDGACDREGRFFCGSMSVDGRTGRAALYRLDPDRSVHVVHSGVTISNGISWSPDGSVAYYVDSPTHRVDACAPDLTGREAFVKVEDSLPDGLTVDAEGGVWVALWGSGRVHRYDPHGILEAVVEVAARQVSSCAFGGRDLATLFITTSAEKLSHPEAAAGALFAVDPGVRGQPTMGYAG